MKKLDKAQVARIRKSYCQKTQSLSQLAEKYEVVPSAIHSIVNNSTHYNPDYEPPKKSPPLDIEYCQDLREEGFVYSAIAKEEAKKTRRSKPFSPPTIREHLIRARTNETAKT